MGCSHPSTEHTWTGSSTRLRIGSAPVLPGVARRFPKDGAHGAVVVRARLPRRYCEQNHSNSQPSLRPRSAREVTTPVVVPYGILFASRTPKQPEITGDNRNGFPMRFPHGGARRPICGTYGFGSNYPACPCGLRGLCATRAPVGAPVRLLSCTPSALRAASSALQVSAPALNARAPGLEAPALIQRISANEST
jgi:hypothetical protein